MHPCVLGTTKESVPILVANREVAHMLVLQVTTTISVANREVALMLVLQVTTTISITWYLCIFLVLSLN
jgi:hypothetical protein